MKRLIARWMISRSIDDPTLPIPKWVQRAIHHDSSLRDYQQSSMQLARRLHQDASHWIADAAVASSIRPASQAEGQACELLGGTGSVALAVALVAGLLIAVTFWRNAPDNQPFPQVPHSPPFAQAPGQRTIDLPSLDYSWNVGRQMVDRLAQHAEDLATTVSVPTRTRLLGDPTEPVASAGIAYGRALATLEREMQQETDRIASDIRGTIHFFAHHLPAQIANADIAIDPSQ